jgi:hypothetical protein
MEFAYPLVDTCSVAWGEYGVWIVKDEAWFADDPFVQAHLDMFSLIPPRVRSTTGREIARTPMSQSAPVSRVKGRVNG